MKEPREIDVSRLEKLLEEMATPEQIEIVIESFTLPLLLIWPF